MATETIQEKAEAHHTDSKASPKAEIQSRWRAGVDVPIKVPVDECWRVFRNFAEPQELMTNAGECTIIEGEPNAINCVRRLQGANLDGSEGICWAHERLLKNDDKNRIQTYRIEENSFGFVNYEGYIKVSKGNDDTSVVTWNLEMDAIPGLSPPPNPVTQMMTGTFQAFIKYAESGFLKKKERKGTEVAVESPTAFTAAQTA